MTLHIKRVCAALAFLASVGGCTRHEVRSVIADPPPVRIGFLLADLSEERYAHDRDAFFQSAARRGATVTFACADNQPARQVAQVQALLAQGIDVLVVQPVQSDDAEAVAVLARRAKVPLVAYDRIIRHADLDAFVTQNSFQVGALQAEAAVNATGGKGDFVLLEGEAGNSVADEITRGNLSILEKHPQIRIVAHPTHVGWSAARAERSTLAALERTGGNLQAILANNDALALGAARALRRRGLEGKVFLAGADADEGALRAIAEGRQTVTVLKRVEPLADAAVKLAMKLARHEKIGAESKAFNGRLEVPVVNTPVELVNRQNLPHPRQITGR